MVLLHGRGASAGDVMLLAGEVAQPGWAFLAPQARNGSWYPHPFRAPIEDNEPWLSSALGLVDEMIGRLLAAGVPHERTVLLGFSQGACLALEFAARNARRYGGIVGLSGALIGPDGVQRHDAGSLAGTPVFLGCGDRDPHIPGHRVVAAADALKDLGAEVKMILYPDLDHSVNTDELENVRSIMRRLDAGAVSGQTDGQ
jgi:predicted esterase